MTQRDYLAGSSKSESTIQCGVGGAEKGANGKNRPFRMALPPERVVGAIAYALTSSRPKTRRCLVRWDARSITFLEWLLQVEVSISWPGCRLAMRRRRHGALLYVLLAEGCL